jgi:hypothetical protein
MEFEQQLTNALATLTEGLDDPSIDLHTLLSELVAGLTESVDSLVSVALTVVADDRTYSVTALTSTDAAAQTSVSIPLRSQHGSAAEARMILLAATPGAFVDIAADIGFASELDPATIHMDTHLSPANDGDLVIDLQQDLEDRSAIDQALGVLLERGTTMHAANLALVHRADRSGIALADAARAVLAETLTSLERE